MTNVPLYACAGAFIATEWKGLTYGFERVG